MRNGRTDIFLGQDGTQSWLICDSWIEKGGKKQKQWIQWMQQSTEEELNIYSHLSSV